MILYKVGSSATKVRNTNYVLSTYNCSNIVFVVFEIAINKSDRNHFMPSQTVK